MAGTLLYFCGHSLGLAPIAARAMIEAEIAHWERLGVLGHEQAASDWIGYAEQLQSPLAQLAGAQPHEVVAMNSLSVNLHLLLASFYRPSGGRRAILIEAGAFSSDRHVVASQIHWHGFDPATRADRAGAQARGGIDPHRGYRGPDRARRLAPGAGALARRAVPHRAAV